MSALLTQARQKLAEVRTLVKHDKLIPAAQAIQNAISVMRNTSLIMNEKVEFERLLFSAFDELSNSKKVREIFPLSLTYTPGQEKKLLEIVKQLTEVLEGLSTKEATEQLHLLEEKKRLALEEAQKHLDNKQHIQANKIFKGLASRFPDDIDLLADIGERCLKAECYEEAYEYLSKALDQSPESIHLYNRVGIALRKLNRFDIAEKYYLKALQIAANDPGLLFNLSRLYTEWHKWDRAIRVAEHILAIQPEFTEAGKLLAFAKKQQEKQSETYL